MNTTRNPAGELFCMCGAVCREKKDEGRFRRRHPSLCTVARAHKAQVEAFNKRIAANVRSVSDEDWLEYEA